MRRHACAGWYSDYWKLSIEQQQPEEAEEGAAGDQADGDKKQQQLHQQLQLNLKLFVSVFPEWQTLMI